MRNIKLIAAMIFILSGCVPVYHTTYTYSPPKDKLGLQCINGCLGIIQSCEASCAQLSQSCEMMNEFNKTNLLNNAKQDYQTSYAFSQYYSGKEQCMNKMLTCQNSCKLNYNACYSNCGGYVEARTECIRNCDKVKK